MRINRIVIVGDPDLFETLGQPQTATSVTPQSLRAFAALRLRLAAIDHHKIRLIGEMTPIRILPHDLRFIIQTVLPGLRATGSAGNRTLRLHAFPRIACDIAMAESSGQSLIQCGKIIERTLAVIASYGETLIFAFLRDRVLEHHHGGNLNALPTVFEMS